MLVKNVTLNTSTKNIWLFFIFFLFFCLLSVCLSAEYLNFSEPLQIPLQIIKGAAEVIASTPDYDDKFIIILCVYLMPSIMLGMVIYSIISRNKALKSESSVLNLMSVDFKPNRIYFHFNRENCDITCSYRDINSLTIEINISKVRTKNGYTNVVNYIALHFVVLGNKHFTLTNTTMNFKGFIYKIIDYTREVKNLNIKYSGDGDHADLDEAFECYLKKGMKPILTNVQENSFKLMSILFFIVGLFFIFMFAKDIAASAFDGGLLILLFVPSIFIVISVVLDIILIIDKIHEKKYESVDTWKKTHSKNELKI